MTPIPENALPNYDKRTIEDPSAFFRTLFHLRDIKEERAIPAVVKDYDAKTGEVTVLPMAKYTFDTRDGEAEVDREAVKVRALKICQGGYSISLPIFKGDTGWLIAGDRRCGAAIEKNGEIVVRDLTDEELKDRTAKPDDCSILNFENGFFVPFSWELEDAEKNPNGNFVIRNARDKIYEKELENEFGVVRDYKGDDVPFIEDLNGKTHSIDGAYHGRYAWSMIEIQRDGMVNAYGEGTKFSIGKEGLYLNDKLTFTHGNGLNTIIGNTEDSVPIAGDVEIVGVDGNVEVKTEIVEDSSESNTKKSRMTIKIVGGGGTTVEDATATSETLGAESDATASVEWDGKSKTLNFSFGIPRGQKGDKGEDGKNGKDGKDGTDGTDGIGIGKVILKSTVGKKKTYSVMSDETTPRELGTFEVNDGTGIGEVKLESTSGRSNTYSIMSDDVPAVKLGTFTVLDGADGSPGQDGDTILSISSGTPTVSGGNTITPITVTMSKSGQKNFNVTAKNGSAGTPDKNFSWEGKVIAKVAATAAISINSKSIVGTGGITVSEANRIITISGSGAQISGYITPEGTYDYEVTGLEWDSTNHRIVIHKVKKTYKNGLLDTREAIADEYIQFVEETV